MSKDPSKSRLVRETKREFRRIKAELDPVLLAKVPQQPHLAHEEFRNIMVAQNTIRPCMEAVIDEMMPFSHQTALELAIRLASYALSIAPMEDQARLVAHFLKGFPNAHDMRLALGVIIKTEWRTPGEPDLPNFPTGPITDPKPNV